MNNHKSEEPVDWVTANNGKLPKWADGTIGWDGREDLHREYLKQHKFNNLDEYDDQVIHDKGRQNTIKKDDADKLRDEIEALDRLCDTPFMKDRHIFNLKADVTKKKENIKSQLSYMKSHNMHDSSLYKQLQGFMNKLNSIESRLNKM